MKKFFEYGPGGVFEVDITITARNSFGITLGEKKRRSIYPCDSFHQFETESEAMISVMDSLPKKETK